MNIKRLLAVVIVSGTVAVTAVGLIPAAAGAATPTTTDTTQCSYGNWPASVEGRPDGLHAGMPAGMALWHDQAGWHAYVTHANTNKLVFRITIQSPSTIDAVGTRNESGDVVVTHADSHSVTLRATNYGLVDGLHFRVACGAGFSVSATAAGVQLPVNRVLIGATGTHPASMPTTIARS